MDGTFNLFGSFFWILNLIDDARDHHCNFFFNNFVYFSFCEFLEFFQFLVSLAFAFIFPFAFTLLIRIFGWFFGLLFFGLNFFLFDHLVFYFGWFFFNIGGVDVDFDELPVRKHFAHDCEIKVGGNHDGISLLIFKTEVPILDGGELFCDEFFDLFVGDSSTVHFDNLVSFENNLHL